MRPLPVRRHSTVGGDGIRGHVVDFKTMAHPDNALEDIVVAIVVWDTGGITSEGLSGLVFVGTIEEGGPTEPAESAY